MYVLKITEFPLDDCFIKKLNDLLEVTLFKHKAIKFNSIVQAEIFIEQFCLVNVKIDKR